MPTSDFVQQLEAQPWFSDVANIFANDKVPAPLWEATIAVEDPSLDPNAVNYGTTSNPEQSHGLFQINIAGNLSGDPARVQAALGTPTAQAEWAASQMAQAIAPVSSADLPTQLQAIEKWAWPGDLSQDPKRQAALQAILGGATPAGGAAAGSGGAASSAPRSGGVFGSVADAINNFTQSAQDIAINVGLGAIGLGLLAAGGVILAGSSPTVRQTAKAALEA